ncbi:Hypothetical protein NGAL_HAMBI490_34160 [Neorhizobium galegae bv. officinalis]|nr:Hypothetical protein NGAL_HAMBI490_34160 [Neorhizobium galegae bv. officinalis]
MSPRLISARATVDSRPAAIPIVFAWVLYGAMPAVGMQVLSVTEKENLCLQKSLS